MTKHELFGVGLYTASEAARLLSLPPAKVRRWLHGHSAKGRDYAPLWSPQITLDDGSLHLGFRDLMELRTAHLFLNAGLSAQTVRRAILLARDVIGDDRPLSTTRLKTDGRSIFVKTAELEDDERLYDLIKNQFILPKIIEQSLVNVEHDGMVPTRWWINSRKVGIVIDPERSFGQPIDASSGVPTSVLAAAVKASGSPKQTASDWEVPVLTVKRAVKFEDALHKAA